MRQRKPTLPPLPEQRRDPALQFGRAMIRTRKERKLSQRQLADQTGVPRQAITRYETGRARLPYDRALIIAEFLDIDLYRPGKAR